MDCIKTEDLSRILGLFDPWKIKNVELFESSKSLVIEIEKKTDKSLFAFMQSKPVVDVTTKRWQHVRFGHFNSFIELRATLEEISQLSTELPPAFLGSAGKSITRELADTIRNAYSRNLTPDMISSLLGIRVGIVDEEIREIETEETTDDKVSLLPLESNEIWRDILTDKIQISTRLLPLKLLLSRLKLETLKEPDDGTLHKSVLELRAFFVRHASQLKHEYDQLGAYKADHEKPKAKPNKLKLVLPGAKSILWRQMLAGDLDIPTESMPLKMCLAQQKRAYRTSVSEAHRSEVVRTLQLFFKHNAKSLVPELKILTELVKQNQQSNSQVLLPDIENEVWQKILLDDTLLESEKINYRLLLSRLKANYRRTNDISYLMQLREFFNQNARSMEEEIQTINRLAISQ